jgi:hypothetical protein
MRYDPAEDEAAFADLEALLRAETKLVRAEVKRLIELAAAARTDEAVAKDLVEGIRVLGKVYASMAELALEGLPDMLHRQKAICALEYSRAIEPERVARIRKMNKALTGQFPVKTVRYQEIAERLDDKARTVRHVIEELGRPRKKPRKK